MNVYEADERWMQRVKVVSGRRKEGRPKREKTNLFQYKQDTVSTSGTSDGDPSGTSAAELRDNLTGLRGSDHQLK